MYVDDCFKQKLDRIHQNVEKRVIFKITTEEELNYVRASSLFLFLFKKNVLKKRQMKQDIIFWPFISLSFQVKKRWRMNRLQGDQMSL
jgi:hypothetical protein